MKQQNFQLTMDGESIAVDAPSQRSYQQVLPMDEESMVMSQFGFLPLSVFTPEPRPMWDKLISDEGDPGKTRRSEDAKYLPGLRFSQFHPHLAESIVRYWSEPGAQIVDPFSGRSTRAVVSTTLGRRYQGYEIVEQVAERTMIRAEGSAIVCADGCRLEHTPDNSADLVFTCPPYHQLERYESAKGQLSDVDTYAHFLERIAECAGNIARVMKPGAFLCWVCADWRDGKAFRMFHADSLRIFQEVSLTPWDIVIVKNNSPFAALQAGKVAAKRYTSKIHEYLLVFRK